MLRLTHAFSVLLVLGAVLPAAAGRAQDGGQAPAQGRPPLTLKSVSIDLPTGEAYPAGPGWDVVDSNCLSCHSAGMVLTQPAMPKAAWEKEVTKMINVYKASISAEDVPIIVAYLDAIKGVKQAEGSAPAR